MKTILPSLLPVLLSPLMTAPAQSAPSYFLQLSGIEGGSTVKGYEKWIDVESYAFEISRAGDAAVGRPQFRGFPFTKPVHTASAKISEHLVTGASIAATTFEVIDLSDKLTSKVITYSFTGVRLESLEHVGAEPGSPLE